MHASAWLSTNPTAQLPPSPLIDVDDHALFLGFDFGHPVGFQAQLFSDKRFNEHLGSFPLPGCVATAMKGYKN